jgi:hypothetical protein
MRKIHLLLTFVALSLATTNLWALPTGALPGMFQVSCGEYVYFSQGNLQYIGSDATPYWKFAEKQYDYYGDNGQFSTNQNVNRDLFGWCAIAEPWKTSNNNEDYSWADWGTVNVSNGAPSGWRIFTSQEWHYLIFGRNTGNTINNTSNARYTCATINTGTADVKGLILFPDRYTGNPTPDGVIWNNINACSNYLTTCTAEGWTALENAGCVFLPAAGMRLGSQSYSESYASSGFYWTSTYDVNNRQSAIFNTSWSSVSGATWPASYALAIRLIQDVPDELEPEIPAAYATTPPTAREGLVYTGNNQSLVTDASGATGGYVRYKLSTSGSWQGSPYATNAGEYIVQWYVKVTDGQCYVDSEVEEIHVTIARATTSAPNPRPTISAAASLTYDGTAQDLVTATGDIQSGYTTVYSTDGVNWSTTIPQGTNAGDYTVYYKFYKGDNYEYVPSPNTINASISRADIPGVILPASTSTIPYDGTEKTLLEIDPVANATIYYKLGSGEWTTTPPTATDADDYSVQYKIVPNDAVNYNTIGPNTVTVTIQDYPTITDHSDAATINTVLAENPAELKVQRTIWADGEYNTLCLPFAQDEAAIAAGPLAGYERLKTFRGARVSGSGKDLSIDILVEDATAIEAGVPYLISYPANHADIVNPVFSGLSDFITTPGAASADGVTFQGMFAQVHIDPYTADREQDYLFLGANSQLMWPEAGDLTSMRGLRAYFIIDRATLTTAMAPVGARARFVDVRKTPTAIESVSSSVCTKAIENGALIILKNGVKYNAQGQIIK